MRKSYCTGFLSVLLILFQGSLAGAQELNNDLTTEKNLRQLILDFWNTDNGLPSNSINEIHIDQDGYLWISSYDGLIRFDGADFTLYNTKNTPQFRTNSFIEFYEDKQERIIWMGTEGGGLIAYRKGEFQVYGLEEDFTFRIQSIEPTGDGRLWIGTRGHGLYTFDPKSKPHFKHIPDLEKRTISSVEKDPAGNFWVGTTSGLFLYDGNHFVRRDMEYGLPDYKIGDVHLDSKGKLWVGTQSGVGIWDFQHRRFEVVEGLRGEGINRITEDRAGSIWFGTGNQMYRLNARTKVLEGLSTQDGLPHRIIKDFALDREGSMWIGTYRGGLCRLKNGKFQNFTARIGLGGGTSDCIAAYGESNNAFLVGTDDGSISFIENDSIKPSPLDDVQLPRVRIKSLLQDKDENIWIGTTLGMIKVNPETHNIHLFNEADRLSDNAVRQIIQTRDGLIWVGTRNGGITRMGADSESLTYFNKDTGFPSNFIMGMVEQPDGSILISTNDIGLVQLKNDSIVAHYTTNDKLPSNLIFNTYTDAEGTVWIATNAGLARLKAGQIHSFSTKDGLAGDALFDVLEDDFGKLWFPTSQGVFFVSKQAFNDFADGKIQQLESTLYDENDGMAEEQCTGATQSLKDARGRLWFPTLNGVTMVDPANIQTNELPPPVRITGLRVDNQQVSMAAETMPVFSSDSRRFVFEYTALSLIAPDKVNFRYKLEKLDKDWVEAGNERQTTYTSLPYGDYTFRVIACNNDGVWNEEGATFTFRVKPFFYQRPVFYILLGLAVVLLVILFFRWRTKLAERRAEQLETLVQERTIELQRQTENLTKSYDRMRVVSEVGQEVVGAGLDVESILKAIYRNMNGVMDATVLAIGLHRENTNRLQFWSIESDKGEIESGYDEVSNSRALSVRCFTSGKSVMIDHYAQYLEMHDLESYRDEKKQPVFSALYVPLRLQNKITGVITVQSFSPNAYSERQLRTLEAIGTYISVAMDNSKVYELIKNTNTRLTDSLRYALTIQQAILPSEDRLSAAFEEYFVIYRPKDIVSGDFYWFTEAADKTFIAVVDCTGHGVPGAFMSMIAYTLLNEIVNMEKVYEPDKILEHMDEQIRIALRQDERRNMDGMELALCSLEKLPSGETEVRFAGAKSPLYYHSEGKLTKLRGSRRMIGGREKHSVAFQTHTFTVPEGTALYMSSDGYVDQASPSREKIGSLAFADLLEKHHQAPMATQRITLEAVLDKHQQEEPQRDDITVLGIRL